MEKKMVVRYLVLVLIFVVLFGGLIFLRDVSFTGRVIYEETADERGAYWNKIDNGDGSYSMAVYNSRINYFDGNEYVPVNTALNTTSCGASYDYCVNANLYQAQFKTNVDWGEPVEFVKDSYDITYEPSDMAYGNTNGIEAEYISNLQSITGTASKNLFNYSDAFPGTDLLYSYTPTQLKEIFVLKQLPSPPAQYVLDEGNVTLDYSFIVDYHANLDIYVGGVSREGTGFQTSEEIEFRNSSGDVVFSFPKPFAYDSNGSITNIQYQIKVQGQSVFAYIRTNYSWLNSSDRVFPVYIDPTIKVSVEEGGGDSYVAGAGDADKNFGALDRLKIGDQDNFRIYFLFNISAIPENQKIDEATLCSYVKTKKVQSVNVSHVYIDFDELTITWNNQPCGTGFDNPTNCNLTAESSVQIDGSSQNTWKCWDIKNMVGKDYGDENDNIAIVLSTGDSNINEFYSKEYADSDLWPYLNITYSLSDLIAPELEIIFPEESGIYSYNESINLNYTVFDENLDSCWYNLDNGQNISLTCGQNATFDTSGGSHTLYLFADDAIGNMNETSVGFTINLGPPAVNLNFPTGNFVNLQNIEFNYTPVDVDLDSCELWGNFTGSWNKNQTDASPTNNQINQFNLNLAEGSYLWAVWCNDTQGNSIFSNNETFTIDTIFPSLSSSEPQGAKTAQTNIPLIFSASDLNLETCRYNVKWSTGVAVIENITIENCTSTSFDVSADGSYVLNLFVNDSAGNVNTTNSSFSVDTSSSSSSTESVYTGTFTGGSTKELEIKQISDLIIEPGESKKMVLSIENTGNEFFNDCRVKGAGENEDWITSDELRGLSAGEEYDFMFTLNIPETLETGSYEIEVGLFCQEYDKLVNFTAEIIKKELAIDLINVNREEGDNLKVTYFITELSGYGQEVSIEIILFGNDNERLAELVEVKNIEAGSRQEFETSLEIEESLTGSFNLLINAVSDTASTFIQEEIILGSPGVGGLAILGRDGNGNIFSIVLVILFGVFAVLIGRRILKLKKLKKGKFWDWNKKKGGFEKAKIEKDEAKIEKEKAKIEKIMRKGKKKKEKGKMKSFLNKFLLRIGWKK